MTQMATTISTANYRNALHMEQMLLEIKEVIARHPWVNLPEKHELELLVNKLYGEAATTREYREDQME